MLTLGLLACGSEPEPEPVPRSLGPVDGEELIATDLERVDVGSQAPDFVLASLSGDTVGLSDYAGESPVVLVFYRGHW